MSELPWDNTGHTAHGGMPPTRKVVPDPFPGSNLAQQEKGHKTGDIIPGQATATCHQGGETKKNICIPNVQ